MNTLPVRWIGRGTSRRAVVETAHPDGPLLRGHIRPVSVEEMTGAGVAGHLTFALTDYDHRVLDPVTGDFRDAVRALLDATKELDEKEAA